MKPFNLEEYLKNPEKKVVTKIGLNVRIICTDRKDLNYPIVALIENQFTKGESVLYYTKEGKIFTDGLNNWDLFFAPEKKEGWTNVYEEGTNRYLDGCICSTEEEAKRIRGCGYITTIKIEWEE